MSDFEHFHLRNTMKLLQEDKDLAFNHIKDLSRTHWDWMTESER